MTDAADRIDRVIASEMRGGIGMRERPRARERERDASLAYCHCPRARRERGEDGRILARRRDGVRRVRRLL